MEIANVVFLFEKEKTNVLYLYIYFLIFASIIYSIVVLHTYKKRKRGEKNVCDQYYKHICIFMKEIYFRHSRLACQSDLILLSSQATSLSFTWDKILLYTSKLHIKRQ